MDIRSTYHKVSSIMHLHASSAAKPEGNAQGSMIYNELEAETPLEDFCTHRAQSTHMRWC